MIRNLIVFVWITGMLCFIALGILDCQMKERAVAKPAPNRALSDEEKAKFMPLARKHGLIWDVNVVYDWPGQNAYYIDKKGRRCSFK